MRLIEAANLLKPAPPVALARGRIAGHIHRTKSHWLLWQLTFGIGHAAIIASAALWVLRRPSCRSLITNGSVYSRRQILCRRQFISNGPFSPITQFLVYIKKLRIVRLRI